jgi:hypothetical protein
MAATQHALKALLAASLLGDANVTPFMLREAVLALGRLPKHNRRWHRRYDLLLQGGPADPGPAPVEREDELPRDGDGADGAPSELFSSIPEPGRDADRFAPLGLEQTAYAAGRLAEIGTVKYRIAVERSLPIAQRVALTVCGLDDDALTADLPSDAEGADRYLDRHKAAWALLDAPPPGDITTRVRRLALLLRRVQLQRLPPEWRIDQR